jgi:hypothetical protein
LILPRSRYKCPFGGCADREAGPSTMEFPFAVQVQARQLPQWGYWSGSKITDNLPPSPVTDLCAAGEGGGCGQTTTLTLVPFGGTNIRISVFPWM